MASHQSYGLARTSTEFRFSIKLVVTIVQASASSMAVITCRSAYICDDQRFLQDATVCRYQLSIPSASFWSVAICASFFLRKVSASFRSLTIEAGALVGITGRVLATGDGLPGGFVARNGATRTDSTGLMVDKREAPPTLLKAVERLHISEHTLRNHLTSIYSKLDLANRLDLYLYAHRRGLLEKPQVQA